MASNKKLGPAKFNNIMVKGDFAPQEKPWTICFYIKFQATPTKFAEQYFDGDLNKFHNDLVRRFGLHILQENLSRAVIPGWQFHLVTYGYDHSPKEFRFEKPLDFQINVYYIAPSEYEEIVEFLVKAGIDSMSVNPDSVNRVRSVVAKVERELEMEKESEFGF